MISKELKFLLSHSSIYGLGTVISRLVAFLLLPLYTRYLTPQDYGMIEIIDITSGLIGIVVSVGIATGMSRFYYESDDIVKRNLVVSTTYIIYSILAIIFVPVLYYSSSPLALLFLGDVNFEYFFLISFSSFLIGVYLDIGILYLRLLKKPVVFISITISRLFFLIFFNILFIVKYELGILGILYSSLLVRSVYALVLTFAILWKTHIKFSFTLAVNMIKYNTPIIPSNLASTFIKQSDKYFVLHFLTLADTGIYALSLRLGNAVHNLLTVPFNMAYIPRRFELMNNKDSKKTYAKIFTYYMFFMIFIGLVISTLIPEILGIMVTPKFSAAAPYVPLVVLSMIIFGTHRHFEFGILYSKQTKYLAYINISTAVINLILNYFLIRQFSLWGGIFSATFVLSLQAFLLLKISNRFYKIEYEFIRILKYLILAALIYGVNIYISFDNLFLLIFVKCILLLLFLILGIILKIISDEEIARIKFIFNNKILSKLTSKIKPSEF
jgi:O-antigen/teichoic acid export membrane protein